MSPNTTYALSYDVKTLSLTATDALVYGAMFVTEYNSSAAEGQDINTNVVRWDAGFVPNVGGTTDWSCKAGTFTTAGNTAYVRVRASLGNFGKAAGTAWFDGVMLERAEASSVYARGTSYGYDAADRMQSAGDITFTWDANGNMRTKVTPSATITYTYDYANRLTQVATDADTYEYTYGGDGIRTSASSDHFCGNAAAQPRPGKGESRGTPPTPLTGH